MNRIEFIKRNTADLRNQLKSHQLYKNLNNIDDIKIFMENHVFAVWDFMSLLKSLQNNLTQTNTPWTPNKNSKLSRFINEIVLEEESDFNEDGKAQSHFEMYLAAMSEINANTKEINDLLKHITCGNSISDSLNKININKEVAEFVKYSFSIIERNQPHLTAAAFTFGREDIIPDMFLAILEKTDPKNIYYKKLKYYLNRHIELDTEEHGPLALQMVSELCNEDEKKWNETLNVARESLLKRIKLWDMINDLALNNH